MNRREEVIAKLREVADLMEKNEEVSASLVYCENSDGRLGGMTFSRTIGGLTMLIGLLQRESHHVMSVMRESSLINNNPWAAMLGTYSALLGGVADLKARGIVPGDEPKPPVPTPDGDGI